MRPPGVTRPLLDYYIFFPSELSCAVYVYVDYVKFVPVLTKQIFPEEEEHLRENLTAHNSITYFILLLDGISVCIA